MAYPKHIEDLLVRLDRHIEDLYAAASDRPDDAGHRIQHARRLRSRILVSYEVARIGEEDRTARTVIAHLRDGSVHLSAVLDGKGRTLYSAQAFEVPVAGMQDLEPLFSGSSREDLARLSVDECRRFQQLVREALV